MMVLHDALDFLDHHNGDVAILDATNTTRKRRHTILEKVAEYYQNINNTNISYNNIFNISLKGFV